MNPTYFGNGFRKLAPTTFAYLSVNACLATVLTATPQAPATPPENAQAPAAEPAPAKKMPSRLSDKPKNTAPKPERPYIVLQKTDADFAWVDAAAKKSPPLSADRHKDCTHMQDEFLIAERKKADSKKGLGAKLKGLYAKPQDESLSARIHDGRTNQELYEICLAYDPADPATLQNGPAVIASTPKPDPLTKETAKPIEVVPASPGPTPAPVSSYRKNFLQNTMARTALDIANTKR